MLSPVLGLSLGLLGFSGVCGVSGFSGFSLKVSVCPLSSMSLCSVTFFGSSGSVAYTHLRLEINGNNLELVSSDNGKGISEKELQKIQSTPHYLQSTDDM